MIGAISVLTSAVSMLTVHNPLRWAALPLFTFLAGAIFPDDRGHFVTGVSFGAPGAWSSRTDPKNPDTATTSINQAHMGAAHCRLWRLKTLARGSTGPGNYCPSMGDSESRAKWRGWYVPVGGLLIAVILVALVLLVVTFTVSPITRWREEADLVFDESILSISQVLGAPVSASADLAWHDGPGVQTSECELVRQASWRFGDVDPADPIGRLEFVVESLTSHVLWNSSGGGGYDGTDLEGATSVWSFRGSSDLWLEAGVDDGERFHLEVFGGPC